MKPDRGDTRAHRNGVTRAMTGAAARMRFSPLRYFLVIAVDAAIPAFSLWFAMFLRLEGRADVQFGSVLPALTLLLVCGRIMANLLLRLHRWSFRLSGLPDGARVGVAGLLGTGVFMLGIFLLRLPQPPRSVVVMELFFSTFLMAAMRFAPRLTWMYCQRPGARGPGRRAAHRHHRGRRRRRVAAARPAAVRRAQLLRRRLCRRQPGEAGRHRGRQDRPRHRGGASGSRQALSRGHGADRHSAHVREAHPGDPRAVRRSQAAVQDPAGVVCVPERPGGGDDAAGPAAGGPAAARAG